MKYSQQQQDAINRYYDTVKREINLVNTRSKGIQSVLVDKQIDQSLLDRRNTNDIENDAFARRAVLNDYTTELIKSGNPYEFQNKIIEEGYDEFFINNFPKIKQESKMFRLANPSNMMDLVKRLYNKAQQELKYSDDRILTRNQNNDALLMLEDLSKNLSSLLGVTTTMDMRQQYQDNLNKVDALIQSVNLVSNQIQFLQDVFGEAYPNIKTAIQAILPQTQPPANPNIAIPPIPPTQPLLQAVSPSVIQQAVNNQIQPVQPSGQNQPSGQAPPKKQLNMDLTTYTDKDIKDLERLTKSARIDEPTYAQLLSDLTEGSKKPKYFSPGGIGTKDEMFNRFMKIYESEKQRQIDIKTNNEQQRKRTADMEKEAQDRETLRLANIKKEKDERERQQRILLETTYQTLLDAYEELRTNYSLVSSKDDMKIILQTIRQNSLIAQFFPRIDGRRSGAVIYRDLEYGLKISIGNVGKSLNYTKKEISDAIKQIENKSMLQQLP